MEIFENILNLKKWRATIPSGLRVAFIPTMGYLHYGHITLIRKAKELADHVIVSIFVNPVQFNDPADLETYPRDIERDLGMLREENIAAVFTPSAAEVYPNGIPDVSIDYPGLSERLCGKNRPGHFQGVLLIVHKLLMWVRPHYAVFGLKDYQQYLLIKKMCRDLSMGTEIIAGDLVRDADGLALSSRNTRLTPGGRIRALGISKALLAVNDVWRQSQKNSTVGELKEILLKNLKGLEIEYADIYSSKDLTERQYLQTATDSLAAIAARVENIRLIDNILLQ